jgi:hypothetical protein
VELECGSRTPGGRRSQTYVYDLDRYDADMYPYGGVRAYNVSCAPNHVFAGKERDSETGYTLTTPAK